MLTVENIHRSFGSKKVLNGVSFTIPTATLCGLIGPSGGGKSVLLKMIGGTARIESGTVRHDFSHEDDDEHGQVSLMFQEGALFDSLSVFDNVAFPLVSGRVPSFILPRERQQEVYQEVSAILARVGLTKAMHKMPGQLSGGMRRRVSLARALVCKPKLVLLDDPTSGLDPVASSVIMNLIVEMQRAYKPTMLIVSHDLRRLLPVVDQVLALFDGQIKFNGTVEELRHIDSEIIRTFVSCRYELDSAA